MTDTSKIELRETMWAHMTPDIYGGENCDKHLPRWNVYAAGDKQDDTISAPLGMEARHFPPGTRVVVSEPVCPDCGETRCLIYPTPKEGPLFAPKCDCGFDWHAWTENEYS